MPDKNKNIASFVNRRRHKILFNPANENEKDEARLLALDMAEHFNKLYEKQKAITEKQNNELKTHLDTLKNTNDDLLEYVHLLDTRFNTLKQEKISLLSRVKIHIRCFFTDDLFDTKE